jgi:hypothetical protein
MVRGVLQLQQFALLRLPAHRRNFGKRLVNTPKLHCLDTQPSPPSSATELARSPSA